jgi:hypothetical protein
MITRQDVDTLQVGQCLYHTSIRAADGSALRARVAGKPETWKRDTERFRISIKYGLYNHGEITPGVEGNAHEWQIDEPAKWAVVTVNGRRTFAETVYVEPTIEGCAQVKQCGNRYYLDKDKKPHLFRFWDGDEPVGTAGFDSSGKIRHLLFCSVRCLKRELAAQALDFDSRR